MSLGSVLSIDYRDKAQRRQLQHALKRLRPIRAKEFERDVPEDVLTSIIEAYVKKYDIQITWSIAPTRKGVIYTAASVSDGRGLGIVYGCCTYEMYAKLLALLCERADQKALKLRRR